MGTCTSRSSLEPSFQRVLQYYKFNEHNPAVIAQRALAFEQDPDKFLESEVLILEEHVSTLCKDAVRHYTGGEEETLSKSDVSSLICTFSRYWALYDYKIVQSQWNGWTQQVQKSVDLLGDRASVNMEQLSRPEPPNDWRVLTIADVRDNPQELSKFYSTTEEVVEALQLQPEVGRPDNVFVEQLKGKLTAYYVKQHKDLAAYLMDDQSKLLKRVTKEETPADETYG